MGHEVFLTLFSDSSLQFNNCVSLYLLVHNYDISLHKLVINAVVAPKFFNTGGLGAPKLDGSIRLHF